MFREQIVNFLEAAVVFLLLTNAVSAAAATYAIRMVQGLAVGEQDTRGIARKVQGMLRGSR
ncbi:MAG TPA: hypothetical protein VK281_16985 [Xanthobacteraceae bacterium]|nr:hypothetical protein [Xanthobacteraceae bacterium]